jgi:type III secretion protein L
LDEKLKELEKEYEKRVLQIAYKACKKIIGIELKTNPEVIVDIIKEALKPVSQHLKVKIFVNKQDLDILENKKDDLKKNLSLVQMFSLEERNDIAPGGCIIETEKGIINAQIENQLKALERAFRAFEKNKL